MHSNDETDVRTQIKLIVADELNASEKSVETRILERMGAMKAESKDFTENYARLIGSEVQRNLVSRTDSIMSKLEQVTSKAAETQAKVTLLERGAQKATGPQDAEIKNCKRNKKSCLLFWKVLGLLCQS